MDWPVDVSHGWPLMRRCLAARGRPQWTPGWPAAWRYDRYLLGFCQLETGDKSGGSGGVGVGARVRAGRGVGGRLGSGGEGRRGPARSGIRWNPLLDRLGAGRRPVVTAAAGRLGAEVQSKTSCVRVSSSVRLEEPRRVRGRPQSIPNECPSFVGSPLTCRTYIQSQLLPPAAHASSLRPLCARTMS